MNRTVSRAASVAIHASPLVLPSVQRACRSVKASWESLPVNAILNAVKNGNGVRAQGVGNTHVSELAVTAASVLLSERSPISLLRERRSIRRYREEAVSAEIVQDLLEAATWAPSSHNRQPWRFCVIGTPAVRDELADRMAEAWRTDLLADGMDAAEIDKRVNVRRMRLKGAPVVIVPSLCMEEMDRYPDALRSRAEWTMGVQSVALACQNLLLAAHAYGLGACWMCAALFVPDLIRTLLELPPGWEPQALITIGYPAEERTSTRQHVAEKTIWR